MYKFERLFSKKPAILAFILSILIVSSLLSFIPLVAEGAPVSTPATLNLKLNVAPKNTGSLIGALAAKLIPNSVGMQIVVTGGSSANDVDNTNSHGSITCLNGTNGNVIWQVDGYPVSIHQPFQIADLYNDGNYKIIVSLWDKTLVLNGNDGSVNWTSIAPSGNVLPAIADVNGDGYPEIFVSSGNGPYRSSDWITMLSHDGTILHQAYTWHPCYGGLTIGDPNGDGKFVLFSTDRSYTYAADNDTYKGGGLGIRAFDAETLTPLWDYPMTTSSSHVPILADVNQDGKLDVIVGNQESNGIEVLNAADGTILGIRSGYTDMPVHLQPTVGDLDGDGYLEFLANNASQPKIWDLYNWKSEGGLFDELGQPLITEEPPKAGNVIGGSLPDIIASAWSSLSNPYANQRNKVYIYEYDAASRKYAIVAVLSNLSNSPNNFSLVTDVDGDGKNELILTGGGRVYVYGTTVPVPVKPARSNLQFYSEYNRGVAEYVAPQIPTQPVLKQEQPAYDSINQPVSPTLSIKVVDYQKQPLTITFTTDASGTWRNIQTFTNVQSGIYSVPSINMGMNGYGTTYNWRVSVTNSKGATTTGNYRFTTYAPSPTQSTPTLDPNAGASKKDLRATTTSTSSKGPTTNIYSWYRNGTNLANLQLPFDTRTSTNPLVLSDFLNDDFENGLGNWNLADGNWRLTTSQSHSGSNSIQAYNGGYYLTSKPLDLSNTESVTISFWYRTRGSPEVYFTLWNGRWNDYLVNLGSSRSDEWQYYSVQTYDRRYLNSTFKLGFDAVGLDKIPISDQQNIWIDDFQISTATKTKDYSGNGLNATVHGATWTRQGLVGGAYSFNGINNWISVPNTSLLDGKGTWSEMTAEFWINPSKLQNGASLLAKKVASARTGSYMIGFKGSGSSNMLYWGITSTADNQWHELSASALSVNKWSFVVCTYKSGQGLTVYINGVQVANLPLTGNIALGPDPLAPSTSVFGQPLFIGGDGTFNPNSWFAGLIDEVKIYPTALTTAQVLQQYNDAADGASDDSIISSAQINTGEVWYSKVTPNDSFSDGLPKLTNAVRIGYSSAILNLTVSSSHGSPYPGVGVTAHDFGSLITATVAGTAVENGVTWTCTGWTGTGSVPSSGTGSNVTFMIAADSTITWNWVQASSPSSPNSPDTSNPSSVVATPTFGPPGGTYSSAQSVVITCNTSSSTIRYTTNGEEPTSSSTLYTNPISVTDGTVTIKAKAFASGLKESSTASATYTIEKSSLKLTVNSAHGNPTPSNTSYSPGQLITLNVSSPVTEDGLTWTCTGWTGTGSVPSSGSDTSVTFTITQDSTITWNWTSSAAADQTMYIYIALTVATLFILTIAGLLLKRRFK